jgi:ATP synthase protein I
MGKQILAAALFALLFVVVRPLEPLAVFAGYLVVLAVGASALLLLNKNPKH